MDDLRYGTRNKRGDWTPNAAIGHAPLFDWPPRPAALFKWLPDYFLPWNVVFMGLGALFWYLLTPSMETMKTLEWGWALFILLRNAVAILLLFGVLELWLYIKRRQGNRFKYNGLFPSDRRSDVFLFKSQTIDSMIRTFGTGLPIWSAYEVLLLWCWSNGWGPWTTFAENPAALIALGLLIPLFHEFHFYCIHRLIHIPFLYKWIHSVHHNSVNPSPWSSLSMHPVEHLLYWSDSLIHLILPSHPLLLLYHLHVTGTGAVVGHIGFDKIETGRQRGIDTQAYAHYLHHKYFEVNYADGLMPLDRWFGTWHDGTREGDRIMQERYRKKKERLKAAQARRHSVTH